jgi:NADPH:quinone reductase-like Zn-dependent oxidoreductase
VSHSGPFRAHQSWTVLSGDEPLHAIMNRADDRRTPSLGTMRAAGIVAFGAAITPLELPSPPEPRDGELLIDVQAAGVGPWDDIARRGEWDLGLRPPMALGVEAAGVVRAVGRSGRFAIGDRVLTHSTPLRWQGAWAERFLTAADEAALLPGTVPFEVGAAFAVPALTADQTVRDALSLGAGQTLLVHGAGGVTGGLVVQVAARLGARVIATAGVRNTQRLLSAGADVVVDYHSPDWTRDVLARVDGAGVDAAVNAVPGGAATVLGVVRSGGALATITTDPPVAERGVRVHSVYVAPDGGRLQQLIDRLGSGELALSVAARYPLEAAHDALQARGAGGAVVLSAV